MQAAAWIVGAVGVYAVAGILFAGVLVARGVGLTDPIAKTSGWAFRILLIPGAAAFLAFARKAMVESMTAPLRRAHFAIWIVLPLLLTVIFIVSLSARHSTTPKNIKIRWESAR